jgi:hypothetical protein
VEWDDGSPTAIRRASDGLVVWERLAIAWTEALRGFAQGILADPDLDPELVEEYLWWCQDPERESVVAVVTLPEDVDRAAWRGSPYPP